MGSKEKPWEPEWERGAPLSGGGHGDTFFARRRTEAPGAWNFVLKVLREQNKPERRARLKTEAAILASLEDHPGVAKLVKANTERWKDDVPLFLITEHVVGTDLEAFRTEQTLSLRDAVRVLIRVLTTLDDCHKRGVTHRDIKPCHVILRDRDIERPILIDFGLGFGSDIGPTDVDTETEQAVGNRFIVLPEQWGELEAKRNPISDITQIVGLLFFLIFRKNPGNLAHASSRKPHERFDFQDALAALEKWRIEQLGRIFDLGFELDPDRRWQSPKALIAELDLLTSDEPPPPRLTPIAERVGNLKSLTQNDATAQLVLRLGDVGKTTLAAVQASCQQVHSELGQHMRVSQAGWNWNPHKRLFLINLRLHAVLNAKQQHIEYELTLRGNEIVAFRRAVDAMHGVRPVISFGSAGPSQANPMVTQHTEIVRVTASDPAATATIQNAIEGDIEAAITGLLREQAAPE
jgi:eukaryotic-like serine/threonine-protein kinase